MISDTTRSLEHAISTWSIPEIPAGQIGMYTGGISELNEEMIQLLDVNVQNLDRNLHQSLVSHRRELTEIIEGKSKKIALFMGPCSISSPEELVAIATTIANMQKLLDDQRLGNQIKLVMRAYFEKPRTSAFKEDGAPNFWGWAAHGIDENSTRVVDPQALAQMRIAMLEVVKLGVPMITEFLNMEAFATLGDLVSTIAVGARTVNGPKYIQMAQLAKNMNIPIGWKNDMDGSIQTASERALNNGGFVILRGGVKPNWSQEDQNQVLEQSTKPACIDVCHANSNKDIAETVRILEVLAKQLQNGSRTISSIMVEWNLEDYPSKTDKGLSLEEMTRMVYLLARANNVREA